MKFFFKHIVNTTKKFAFLPVARKCWANLGQTLFLKFASWTIFYPKKVKNIKKPY